MVQVLLAANRVVFVTASTGIAATNVKGMTLHSWAGIGIANLEFEQLFFRCRNSHPQNEWWTTTDVLIIDEVSKLYINYIQSK